MGKIIFISLIRETSLLFMGSLEFSRGGRDRKDVSIYWAHTLSHASQGILYVPHHGIARLKHPKEEGTSFSLSVTRKLALEEVKLPKSQVIIVQTSAFSLICSIYVSIVTTARERILGTEEWVGRVLSICQVFLFSFCSATSLPLSQVTLDPYGLSEDLKTVIVSRMVHPN